MSSARSKLNRKRRFASSLPAPEALMQLAAQVRYGGNPAHKRNPGDYKLSPPAQPRDDKSLCDRVKIFKKGEALKLLQEGILRGLVSEWDGNGFPKNVWSMTPTGAPLEAQIENPENGTYHGYPLEDNDPFREAVIAKWNRSKRVNE
jgi:hypothetical protein